MEENNKQNKNKYSNFKHADKPVKSNMENFLSSEHLLVSFTTLNFN